MKNTSLRPTFCCRLLTGCKRCDPRGWRCAACGMTLPQVSAVLRHECASEKSLALPVRSTLRKCHPALQAQPQVSPKTNAGLANRLSFYNDAASSHFPMVTIDSVCNESLLLPLQPAKRCLQLGDFFPHPDTKDAFCCVWSPPAHGAAMVVDLHPFPRRGDCRQHSGGSGCWRFSSSQPYSRRLPSLQLTEPLLVARPLTKRKGFAKLQDHCFQKCVSEGGPQATARAQQLQQVVGDVLSAAPPEDSTTFCLKGQALQIFEDIAVVDLAYLAMPDRCPRADDAAPPCHIRLRGTRMLNKYIDLGGVKVVPWQHLFFSPYSGSRSWCLYFWTGIFARCPARHLQTIRRSSEFHYMVMFGTFVVLDGTCLFCLPSS